MSRPPHVEKLRQAAPGILPSLLACDFGHLEREVRALEATGVPALHLDVMDGNFVPNLTYGMPIVAAVRKLTKLPLDAHLMIANPQKYIGPFREAGADHLTIHIEAVDDPRRVLTEIQRLGAGAGLALNPATPLEKVEPYLDLCDLVLVMSVPAGFGGQKFHTNALDKLRRLKELVGDEVLLEVDGGVNEATIHACAEAGAQLFVVGSAIFNTPDYGKTVGQLRQLAKPDAGQ